MTPKGEATRGKIIGLVSPLFNLRGFRSTSIAEITNAIGLRTGGLYNHFQNKQQLEVESLGFMLSRLQERQDQLVSEARNGREAVAKLLDAFELNVRVPLFPGGCPMINAGLEAANLGGALADRARESVSKLQQLLENFFYQGLEDGSLVGSFDPFSSSVSVLAQLEGGWLIERIDPSTKAFDITLANLRDWLASLGGAL